MLRKLTTKTVRRALRAVLTLRDLVASPTFLLPTQLVLQHEVRRRHPVVHFAGAWDGRTGEMLRS